MISSGVLRFRPHWCSFVLLLCALGLSGCNGTANDIDNDIDNESESGEGSMVDEDSEPATGEDAQSEFLAIDGFWNIASPGSSTESYLVINGNGEAVSYVGDPDGKNCFYAESRQFTSLGDDRFLMISPDSDSGPAELELIEVESELQVTTDSGQVVSWPAVVGFSAADLQICESTV